MLVVGDALELLCRQVITAGDYRHQLAFKHSSSGCNLADCWTWVRLAPQLVGCVDGNPAAALPQVDAEARLTAAEALAHPWVQGRVFEEQHIGMALPCLHMSSSQLFELDCFSATPFSSCFRCTRSGVLHAGFFCGCVSLE